MKFATYFRSHKRWSYIKSATRIIGFAVLIVAEAMACWRRRTDDTTCGQ